MKDVSKLHQGHSLDNERFIGIICDDSDIKGKMEEMKIDPKCFEAIKSKLQDKMPDFLMSTFWECIEYYAEEHKKQETKRLCKKCYNKEMEE